MKKPLTLFVLLVVVASGTSPAHGQDIHKNEMTQTSKSTSSNRIVKAGYFEYPGPAYTDTHGKPAGVVNEITMRTPEHAGINDTIIRYPAARFFEYIAGGGNRFIQGFEFH